MKDISLNFINNSNDINNSQIVIFQKNVATSPDETAVAWTVIQNCGKGDNHPFKLSTTIQVGAGDSWGNYTPQLEARSGQAFSVAMTPSGTAISAQGNADDLNAVQVRNDLPQNNIEARAFKNGKLLAVKSGVAPGQGAAFQFKPSIWIGAISQIEEGQIMNSAILSAVNTEISLLGIASANIVMTGGGPGPQAKPFAFVLENVVPA